MQVKLEEHFKLKTIIDSIRCCYQSEEKSDSHYVTSNKKHFHLGEKDKKLINTIINKGHDSTLEHIVFHFNIKGVSRLCLQELARHRVASFSVKSTRYTLTELKNENCFIKYIPKPKLDRTKIEYNYKRAGQYIRLLDIKDIDNCSISALENIRKLLVEGKYTIDQIKYCLPECYLTNLHMTINLRSLRNFLKLRTSPRAHFEIRELANKMYECLPEQYEFLVKDCLNAP